MKWQIVSSWTLVLRNTYVPSNSPVNQSKKSLRLDTALIVELVVVFVVGGTNVVFGTALGDVKLPSTGVSVKFPVRPATFAPNI